MKTSVAEPRSPLFSTQLSATFASTGLMGRVAINAHGPRIQ
ncbi:hypothetical protein [Trichocoleus desertorum]